MNVHYDLQKSPNFVQIKNLCKVFSPWLGLICILLGASFLLVTHYLPPGFKVDDETLLAFDHIKLAINGAYFWDFNFARIPSLFPDYFFALVSWLLSEDHRMQFLVYSLLQCSSILLLTSLIVGKLASRSFSTSLMASVGGSLLLILLVPDYAWKRAYAYLPIHHGGNLVTIAFSIWLYLGLLNKDSKESKMQSNTFRYLLLSLTIIVSVISNRIYIVQFAIPVILLELSDLLMLCRSSKSDRSILYRSGLNLILVTFLSAAAGYALSNSFINTGCIPPIKANLMKIFSVSAIFQFDASSWILLLALLAALFFALFSTKQFNLAARKVFGLMVVSSITSFFLNLIVETYSPEHRYLMPTYWFVSVISAILLVMLWPKLEPIHRRWRYSVVLFVLTTFFVLSDFSNFSTVRDYLNYEPETVSFLKANIPNGSNVLVITPDDIPSSRTLKAASKYKIHVSRVAANGLPDEWDQSKSEFVSTYNSKQLRDYQYLYLSKSKVDEKDQLPAMYQEPIRIINDSATGNQIWEFSGENKNLIQQKMTDYLLGPFRIDCM